MFTIIQYNSTNASRYVGLAQAVSRDVIIVKTRRNLRKSKFAFLCVRLFAFTNDRYILDLIIC